MSAGRTFSHQQVYQLLDEVLAPGLHAKRIASLADATVGVMHTASLAVCTIGHGLAIARGLNARHAVKQVDRMLSNPGIDVDQVLALWVPFVIGARTSLLVAMDWTDFDADHQASIMLSLITEHGRATPLVWLTVNKADLKTRFSQFPCQSGCNQEYASGLQQGLNDEAASVVAQAEALVLQQPTERALDGPAVSAQAGAMRSSALVDERLDLAGPAELTVPLGIIAFVGICIADARHDGEGGEKQPLKDERVGHVGGGGQAGHRRAVSVRGNVVFGAHLSPVRRVGTDQIAASLGPHRAAVEDQGGV